MSPKNKKILQFVILLALGGLIIWLILKQVSGKKDEIIDAFENADYFWLAMSGLISIVGHVLRAYRWNYLLEPMGYRSKFWNANGAVFIGYLANYGLPRMGELTRCTVVAKYDGIPFEKALGTVITERIIDFFLLLLVFGLTLLFQFSELIGLADKYIFSKLKEKLHVFIDKPILGIALAIVGLICVAALFYFRKKIKSKLTGKFGNAIKGFGGGIASVKQTRNKGMFVLISISIWFTYLLGLYFGFFAFKETSHLGFSEGLVLLLFATFGVIFTPGGIGAYQWIVMNVLMYYAVSDVAGFAYGWAVWTTQLAVIVVLGLTSLIVLPLYNKEKNVAK
ncbi:MAG: lysylphosphatidylglycerol synthase transmembrane domain-containing protein [Bacteroidota bacterium]|nr:lysylphosphatidylglycerol synthase transmembrane domain-containing protein [Bacteroidota bacterium]